MKAPSVEAVRLYWGSAGLHGDPEEFYDHFTANGWMVGKVKMADWTAAARNWSRHELKWARKPKSNYPSRDEILSFNKATFGLNAQDYLERFRQKFGCDPKEI